MSSAVGWFLVILVIGTAVWLIALVDVLTGGIELDQTGRLLFGLLLIFAAPVGTLAWIAFRLARGQSRRFAASLTVLVVLATTGALGLAIAAVQGFGNHQSSGGFSTQPAQAVAAPAYQPGPPPVQGGLRTESYALNTQCGIHVAWIEGQLVYANPSLDDGHGHAPPGWATPEDPGLVTINVSTGAATFVDGGGHTAHFSLAPAATPATGPLPCS